MSLPQDSAATTDTDQLLAGNLQLDEELEALGVASPCEEILSGGEGNCDEGDADLPVEEEDGEEEERVVDEEVEPAPSTPAAEKTLDDLASSLPAADVGDTQAVLHGGLDEVTAAVDLAHQAARLSSQEQTAMSNAPEVMVDTQVEQEQQAQAEPEQQVAKEPNSTTHNAAWKRFMRACQSNKQHRGDITEVFKKGQKHDLFQSFLDNKEDLGDAMLKLKRTQTNETSVHGRMRMHKAA